MIPLRSPLTRRVSHLSPAQKKAGGSSKFDKFKKLGKTGAEA